MSEIELKVDADLEIATRSDLLDEKDAILIQVLREVQRLSEASVARLAERKPAKKNFRFVAK